MSMQSIAFEGNSQSSFGRTVEDASTNWPVPICLAGTRSSWSARISELASSVSSSYRGTCRRVLMTPTLPLLTSLMTISRRYRPGRRGTAFRSEEHTSELQSHLNLVCRLLLEKKKKNRYHTATLRLVVHTYTYI